MTEEIKDETYFRLKEEYLSELQRLKQENEELTEQLDEECLRVTKLATENTKLEQENELLKEKLEIANNSDKRTLEILQENEELKKALLTVTEGLNVRQKEIEKLKLRENELTNMAEQTNIRINTYRSALEEIREKIKSLNKDICNNCGWYNTDNCQPNGYVCHDLIEIKNKINEVLK